MEHIDYIQLRLSHERIRLAQATTPKEREYRQVYISQIEKELASEYEFLAGDCEELSDDELLAELTA